MSAIGDDDMGPFDKGVVLQSSEQGHAARMAHALVNAMGGDGDVLVLDLDQREDAKPETVPTKAFIKAVKGEGEVEVFAVKWWEHEYDFGVIDRPDGYSLHLSEEDAQSYVKDYAKRNFGASMIGAGDYFMFPEGADDTVKVMAIKVDRQGETYRELLQNGLDGEKGLRYFETNSNKIHISAIKGNFEGGRIPSYRELPVIGLSPKPFS